MKKPSITLQVPALNKQSPPLTPTGISAKFTTSTGGQVVKRTPETISENENESCTILWDTPVLLIDVSEFAERNTSVKMLKSYQNI